MKIAAAYLRVSTERQDEYSLDSQLKLIREYAAKNDYIVPEEFVFVDDGISGRSAKKRTQFQNMIAWAKDKTHPFEAILVWKFSRFARNQEESIFYKSMLSRSGVDVISISEPLAEGPFGSLIERILEWMDEFYSIRLSGEVKRGMAEKVSRGEIVTIASFGYDIVGKTYVPNDNADIVRRIYSDYLAGDAITSIARRLGLAGVRTTRGNKPDNRWVRYILQNPVYVGKLRWSSDGKNIYSRSRYAGSGNSILVDGRHEKIIDDATWNAVQEKIALHDRSTPKYTREDQPVEWMLKGLVRCSNCGSTLVYAALSCPSMQCHRYAHGTCEVSHSLSIAKANRLVIGALETCAATSVFPLAPQSVKKSSGSPDYEKQITLEQNKLRRIQEAYEAGIDSLAEYASKKAKITAEIKSLRNKAEKDAPVPVNVAAYKKKVLKVLDIIKDDSSTESAKNAALKTIISYIVYEKQNKRLAIYFYT